MIVLVRVDERLIHGQVVIGWHSVLKATVFVVVDNEVAATDWQRDLVLAGVPEGTRGEVFSVAEAVRAWAAWTEDAERRLILLENVPTLAGLFGQGVPLREVNIGGLHRRPGRREVVPYVYLDDGERATCVRLCSAGVRLQARDVPSAGGVDLCGRLRS